MLSNRGFVIERCRRFYLSINEQCEQSSLTGEPRGWKNIPLFCVLADNAAWRVSKVPLVDLLLLLSQLVLFLKGKKCRIWDVSGCCVVRYWHMRAPQFYVPNNSEALLFALYWENTAGFFFYCHSPSSIFSEPATQKSPAAEIFIFSYHLPLNLVLRVRAQQ